MQHIHAKLTIAYLHGVVKFVEACTDNSLAAVLNMVTLQVYVVEGRKPSNWTSVVPMSSELYSCVSTIWLCVWLSLVWH